uniref:Retrotransposon gag domain-containing protein n=1 Tax=Phlebotomus papatasi TaxID=29031 RepID=A0A1B0FY30_PHLPP
MEQFFQLNGIDEDKRKCAAFITFAGQLCLKILKAAIQPDKVSSKSYKDIIGILKEKFAPKRSVTAERFKFHERRQQEGESISEYVSELQVLAQTCNFGNFLKDALRDKLVCGIQSKAIQGRLLAEDKSFEDTLKRAMAMELAEKNTQLMQPSGEIAAIRTRQIERGSSNKKTRNFVRRERDETQMSEKQGRVNFQLNLLNKYIEGTKKYFPIQSMEELMELEQKMEHPGTNAAVVESDSHTSVI